MEGVQALHPEIVMGLHAAFLTAQETTLGLYMVLPEKHTGGWVGGCEVWVGGWVRL